MREAQLDMLARPLRICVVLRTHNVSKFLYEDSYLPLKQTLPKNYDLVVAHDETKVVWDTDKFPVDDLLLLDEESMKKYNSLHTDNWYNIDSLLGYLYVNRSEYDYYWFIEYDVRFSGDWADFFHHYDSKNITDAILINGMWKFNGDSSWWVWDNLNWKDEKLMEERYAAFVFVARCSRHLMQCVHDNIGISSGYAEVYLATFCSDQGLSCSSVDKKFRGSICDTVQKISAAQYNQLKHEEPNKLFHKVHLE